MRKVVITGILGQDGANMAEYLLNNFEDIQVIGVMRRSSNPNYTNISSLFKSSRFKIDFLDLGDSTSIEECIKKWLPDYFINFGANSFVGVSWKMPEQVFNVNAVGVLRCLEAIRKVKPDCKFYSAGSSEEWGDVDYSPQDISHPIKPRSPYGASKAAARHLVKVYRESYNMYAVHGILFNHEGTKRGEEFVTRKISKGVARIKNAIDRAIGLGDEIYIAPIELGNLDAKRDWSDSRDFVEGVWLMLNQDAPKDYILASGETHSIREFVEKAFAVAGINGSWHGQGLDEVFVTGQQTLVRINPDFYRPAEVDLLLGDSTPIREELGWKPKISFDELVRSMVLFDIEHEY
jgi:GDPmannose 4,6-dehydratase